MKVVIDVLEGARAGERLTFDGPRSLRFGRHPDNDVAFDAEADRGASSRHAELRLSMHGYRIFDLGSANGTTVDGRRVERDGAPIAESAELVFGKAGPRCRLTVLGEGAEPPTVRDPVPPVEPHDSRRYGASTIAGIVDEALRRQGRGQRLAIGIAAVCALGGTAAAVMFATQVRPSAMRRELAALVTAQAGASDAERARLQAKIDELARRMSGGVEIAKANHGNVFLVVARGSGSADGFCTAFAAAPRRLLTNAHCVEMADELKRKGSQIEIVPNGGGPARPVVRWRKAPGFRAASNRIGVDVGWLETEVDLPAQVRLADQSTLEAISAGDTMSTYGFPGRLADTAQPEATYVTGVIGRVTSLDGRPASARDGQLLQHSAFTTAGTSGSPLFDAAGRVIGINAGGYVDDSAAGRPLPGYNFAMRIDLAVALLNEADE